MKLEQVDHHVNLRYHVNVVGTMNFGPQVKLSMVDLKLMREWY